MSEIIKEWLTRLLGIIVEGESWDRDVGGMLLAKILHRYDLLTEEQLKKMEDVEQRDPIILEYMRETINRRIGVPLSKENYQEILEGKGTKMTTLLYEMYLTLRKKNQIDFFAENKVNQLMPNRFTVEEVKERSMCDNKFDNPLAQPLHDNLDIIQWYKTRTEVIIEKCKNSRENYLNFVQARKIPDTHTGELVETITTPKVTVKKIESDFKEENLSYGQLIKEERAAKKLECIEPDAEISRKIINNIKKKRRKIQEQAEMRDHFQKLLIAELWGKVLKEQDEYYKNDFIQTLLKQSVFEQQIVTRLMEVRSQQEKMRNNKYQMVQCVMKAAEQKFCQNVSLSKEYMEQLQWYIEKERKIELHQRLFEEKLKRRAERHYNLCLEVLQDITDMAIYTSEYKENFNVEDVGRRKKCDLASLFIKSQPIFDLLEDMNDIIDYEEGNLKMDDEKVEEIICIESDRQHFIDELSFESYLHNQWPWELDDNIEIDKHALTYGLNTIGFIVHRLLLAKYPMKPLPLPPAIPKPTIAACINGFHEMKYLPALEKLLKARKIQVIQMEDAINYCLSVFKEETTVEYLDSVFKKEAEIVLEKMKSTAKAKTNKSADSRRSFQETRKSRESDALKPLSEDKSMQTPKVFPDEPLVLSRPGELGQMAFEILNLGDVLNDNLQVSIFIEYLKTIKGCDGWVLINYPQTYEQAITLEEALTGVVFPKDYIKDTRGYLIDLEPREIKQNVHDFHGYDSRRISKLLPNPKPEDHAYNYDTYLTAYIEIISEAADNAEERYYDCFKLPLNKHTLNTFYCDQGCKYTLNYKEMDFPTIKHLGKIIMGEFSLPPKPSVEVFTDIIKYIEAEWDEYGTSGSKVEKVGEKKAKPKPRKTSGKKTEEAKLSKTTKGDKGKKSDKKSEKGGGDQKSGKSKGDKKSGKSKGDKKSGKDKKNSKKLSKELGIEHEDKETQIPEIVEKIEEAQEEPEEEPKPGEANWIYINLPIQHDFEVALAAMWANIEKAYINNIKLLFFRQRTSLDSLEIYLAYVYTNMMDFIRRPDAIQTVVYQFQSYYNHLDDDIREDYEVKAELHARIYEFREGLCETYDKRMKESEFQRGSIVENNWITNLLYDLTNIYISFMQVEVDRCTDTLQMLFDYYMFIVTNMPSPDKPLEKIQVETIQLPLVDVTSEHLDPYIKFTEQILKQPGVISYEGSPFEKIIEKNANSCLGTISEYRNSAKKIHDKLKGFFNPQGKKGRDGDSKATSAKFIVPDEEVRSRSEKLILECETALTGEILRAELYINLIKRVYYYHLEDTLDRAAKTFHNLFRKIQDIYTQEMNAVEECCSLIGRAVEAEEKIQPEMVIEDGAFFVRPEVMMFTDPVPDFCEFPHMQEEENFTVLQIQRLIRILFDIAPTGVIPERCLAFLLQDFLTKNAEDGQQPIVPKMWMKMDPSKTQALMHELFGNSAYVDWKDFILYILDIPFPTESQLLATRLDFRRLDPDFTEVVYDYQIEDVAFWFETSFNFQEPEEVKKFKQIKDILVRLYKIDDGRVNYTALLLSFCKDKNPIIGLVKAMELSTGRIICWDVEKGSHHLEVEMDKIYDEEVKQLAKYADKMDDEYMAMEIVTDVVNMSMQRSSGVVITEEEVNESISSLLNSRLQASRNSIELYKSSLHIEEDIVLDYLRTQETAFEQEEEGSECTIFTNISQGMEAVEPIKYDLHIDDLINILTALLPWLTRTHDVGDYGLREKIALIYQTHWQPKLSCVFAFQLFNDPHFINLIKNIYKFYEKQPRIIVRHLISE